MCFPFEMLRPSVIFIINWFYQFNGRNIATTCDYINGINNFTKDTRNTIFKIINKNIIANDYYKDNNMFIIKIINKITEIFFWYIRINKIFILGIMSC